MNAFFFWQTETFYFKAQVSGKRETVSFTAEHLALSQSAANTLWVITFEGAEITQGPVWPDMS